MPRHHDRNGHYAVSTEQVARAKELMRDPGLSLDQAARIVGCLRRDLDLALWNWIGWTPEQLGRCTSKPMFD